MTASGTFGYGLEFADFVNLEDIGGIIVKGTTLKPREGNLRQQDLAGLGQGGQGNALECGQPLLVKQLL